MSDYPWQNPRVFNYFLNFPRQIQMMVVDEMQPIERCKFIGCSKLSNKMGKASRNYIYELSLDDSSADFLEIKVVYINDEKTTEKWIGFRLLFCKNDNKKYFECQRIPREYEKGHLYTMWKFKLDDSENLVQSAARIFKDLLQKHQNTVKKIVIGGITESSCSEINNFDFGIERLNNLESLVVNNDTKISQFISKIRHPLKRLIVCSEENCRDLANSDVIYNVRDDLYASHLKLNRAQFSRLSALNVSIHIGSCIEEDVSNLIQSWRNGTKKLEEYVFNFAGSNFKYQKLVALLGQPDLDLEHECYSTVSFVDFGYDGLLHSTDDDELTFVAVYMLDGEEPVMEEDLDDEEEDISEDEDEEEEDVAED